MINFHPQPSPQWKYWTYPIFADISSGSIVIHPPGNLWLPFCHYRFVFISKSLCKLNHIIWILILIWLIFLSIKVLRSIHIVECINSSFFLLGTRTLMDIWSISRFVLLQMQHIWVAMSSLYIDVCFLCSWVNS